MTILIPMTEESFNHYGESFMLRSYAKKNIETGRWPDDGYADERATIEFRYLLPDKLSTPNNYLFDIKEDYDGATVGFIWLVVEVVDNFRTAFVYGIEVEEKFRRQGHASTALSLIENFVINDLQLPKIGLHVFDNNHGARALYKKMGYKAASHNLYKDAEFIPKEQLPKHKGLTSELCLSYPVKN